MVFRRRKTFRKRRSLKKRRTMRKRIMKGGVIKYGEFSGLPQTGEDVKIILGDLDRSDFDESHNFAEGGSLPVYWYKGKIWMTSSTQPGNRRIYNIINSDGEKERVDASDHNFQRSAIVLKRRWPSTASMNQ